MLGQLLGHECWKVREPPAMCLGLAQDKATGYLGGGFGN